MKRRHIEYFAASSKAFGDVITPQEGDNESHVFRGQKGQEFLHQIAAAFIGGITAIKEKYRDEQQPEEIAKLAGSLLTQLPAAIEKFLKPIALGFLLSQGKLYQRLNSQPNDAAAAIERAELRNFLRNTDGKERLRIFQEAAESGNDKIMGVFLQNSEIYNLLSKDILAAGQQKWLSKRDPALAKELSENERAGSILAENFKNCINDLAEYASIEPEKIQSMRAALPTPGWVHKKSRDAQAIDNYGLQSMLPAPENKPVQSAVERLAVANKD